MFLSLGNSRMLQMDDFSDRNFVSSTKHVPVFQTLDSHEKQECVSSL